jgi:hypothetical protein
MRRSWRPADSEIGDTAGFETCATPWVRPDEESVLSGERRSIKPQWY